MSAASRNRRYAYPSLGFGLAALVLLPISVTAAQADEIVVRIHRITALDKADRLSRPDLLARVTIAGETFVTAPIRNQADIQPEWVFKKSVPPGNHDVKVEILDKDVTKMEPIDINRVGNKRDLDFTVNTKRCLVTGFKPGYRCGAQIVRAGNDAPRRAELRFSVDVRR